jgi:polysaccharide biosynthesis protein PslJ
VQATGIERGQRLAVQLLVAGLLYLSAHYILQAPPLGIPVAAVLCLGAIVAVHPVAPWRGALVVLVLVILFIPIRRYAIPSAMPFQMEPYRFLVALLLAGWGLSLLADERVRLRRSGLEGPLGLLLLAALLSEAANPGRAAGLQSEVVKALTFLLGFLLVFWLIVSVIDGERDVDRLLQALVAGGALVAVAAVYESRSGVNVFNHLPVLHVDPKFSLLGANERGDATRAYASAQHPIALSAMLVMLTPLSLYLGLRPGRQRLWWIAAGLLTLGMFATLSRTGVVMLFAVVGVFLWLRRAQTVRFWPVLLPLLVAVHVALPGTIGTLKAMLLPTSAVIAQQQGIAKYGCGGQGRLGKIGAAASDIAKRPALGLGYGTRVTDGKTPNACVLDDQWLSTAEEIGLIGVFALLWMFKRLVGRLGRAAKARDGARGWLYVALCSSIFSFAIGMLTFDELSFIQVTFVLFIVMALACVTLRGEDPAVYEKQPRRRELAASSA